MMVAKKLISIRVLEDDWGAFMEWADKQGSNATAELNRYIRQCLGRNDSDNESVQTVTTVRNDSEIQELKAAIAKLQGEFASSQPVEIPDIEKMVSEKIEAAIANLTEEFGEFKSLRDWQKDIDKSHLETELEKLRQQISQPPALSDIEGMVKEAIAKLPKSEPVDIKGLHSRLDQLLEMQGGIIGRLNKLEDHPLSQPTGIASPGMVKGGSDQAGKADNEGRQGGSDQPIKGHRLPLGYDPAIGFKCVELSAYFDIAKSSVSKKANETPDEFGDWSKTQDPNGFPWRFEGDGRDRRFFRVG